MASRPKRNLMRALVALGAIAGVGLAVFMFEHRRVSSTQSYFDQLAAGKVNADVEATLELIAPVFDSSTGDFSSYGDYPMPGYKYSLAFTAYGLANIAAIEPARAETMAAWIDTSIKKMLVDDVWKDWNEQGWGRCPLTPDNIMWKGHLNLMYALHVLVSGEDTYAPAFHALSGLIAREMRSSNFGGALCEHINYYFQCNTVSMLSLRYHDVFYGSSYGDELQAPWLEWARENFVVTADALDRHNRHVAEQRNKGRSLPLWPQEARGLFYAAYHPKSAVMDQRLSGYTNAWAVTFLSFFDAEWAAATYESYKATFIHEIFGFAYAEEEPGRGMDGLATLFALFAANEMHDTDLLDKLLNLFALAGREKFESVNPEFAAVGAVVIDLKRSAAIQGPLLFGKTNIGLARLFATARPVRHPPPAVSQELPEDWLAICPGMEPVDGAVSK